MFLKIKSKIIREKRIIKNSENKMLEIKEKKLDVIPKNCYICNSEEIKFWDETNEEKIYMCLSCKHFIAIPFDVDKIRFYFI